VRPFAAPPRSGLADFLTPAAVTATWASRGRIAAFNPYGPFSDPMLLESELIGRCMLKRGYRLEPLRPER
jgi:hypothetical protein